MQFVRSVLLGAACMAACVSYAQSSGQWRFSMDDARRVTGMTWSSNSWSMMEPVVAYDQLTSGNRVQVRRINGPVVNLPQQLVGRQNAFTVTPSGAVIEIPSRVPIPGRSSQLPVTVVEPVSRGTLNNMAAKALRVAPLVGTAFQIYDLVRAIDELDAEVNSSGQLVPKQRSQVICGSASSYSEWRYYIYQTFSTPGVYECGNDSMIVTKGCPSGNNSAPSGYLGYNTRSTSEICSPNNDRFHLYYFAKHPEPTGSFLPSSPTQSDQPLSEADLIARAANLSLQTLVYLLNTLPRVDDRVIDVYARELKDDPVDHWVKFFNTGANAGQSVTVQIGEPVVTTTTNPDGSTVTTTTTTTATSQGNHITFNTQTQTVTKDAAGNTTSSSTITTTPTDTSNPNSPQQEDLECGLPGTPPCKIDETGTPPPPQDDGENTFKGLIPNCLKQDWRSCFPELPDINWSFSLPSGCSPIPVPFGKYGFNHVDICPWQGMIHDLMSMLWAAAGLFGAIGILSGRRNSEA